MCAGARRLPGSVVAGARHLCRPGHLARFTGHGGSPAQPLPRTRAWTEARTGARPRAHLRGARPPPGRLHRAAACRPGPGAGLQPPDVGGDQRPPRRAGGRGGARPRPAAVHVGRRGQGQGRGDDGGRPRRARPGAPPRRTRTRRRWTPYPVRATPPARASPSVPTAPAWSRGPSGCRSRGEHVRAALGDQVEAGESVVVSGGLADVYRPTATITTGGVAWVLFGRRDDGGVAVWGTRWTGAGWTEPEQVTAGGHPAFNQEVVALPDGGLEVCWQARHGDRFAIFARRWTPVGGWGATVLVSSGVEANVWDPTVAAFDDGATAYAWSEYADGAYRVVVRRRACRRRARRAAGPDLRQRLRPAPAPRGDPRPAAVVRLRPHHRGRPRWQRADEAARPTPRSAPIRRSWRGCGPAARTCRPSCCPTSRPRSGSWPSPSTGSSRRPASSPPPSTWSRRACPSSSPPTTAGWWWPTGSTGGCP